MTKNDLSRNLYMLNGALGKNGYDWWWHSFTGRNEKTGEELAFYIEYFFCNPKLSNGQVKLGQGDVKQKPSYFMMNAGYYGKSPKQIHQFYPTTEVAFAKNELNVSVNDCLLTETHIKGSCTCSKEDSQNPAFMSNEGKMEWDLKVDKKITFNVGYGASKIFRDLNAFEMFWHAQGIKTLYEGYVIADGVKYIVDRKTSFGYADKNWGKNFTSPWVWISSNNLFSEKHNKKLENSAIEIGGGRPKVLGIALNRKILIDVVYEGEKVEFNFSKFWKPSKVEFDFKEESNIIKWNVKAKNRKYRMDLNLSCAKNETLLINYESPDGNKLYKRLFNAGNGYGDVSLFDRKGNLVDKIQIKNAGCEYGEYGKEDYS